MKEFEFVEKLQQNFGGGVEGIGDDAALFGGKYLIAKDIMAEGVHFLPSAPIDLVIMKLFTSNVSDIAAMGGEASHALFALAAPANADLEKIFEGVKKASEYYGVKVIGGDTSESKGGLFLSLTIIGMKGENLLTRSGASKGDAVYLSRPTGLSKISLEKELGLKNWNIDPLDHYERRAENEVGKFLGTAKGVTSAIDISDGIGVDAARIAKASGVKIIIKKDLVNFPCLEPYGKEMTEYAISSGEEFALLFTVMAESETLFKMNYQFVLKTMPIKVGYVEEGEGCFLHEKDLSSISFFGYEHFKI